MYTYTKVRRILNWSNISLVALFFMYSCKKEPTQPSAEFITEPNPPHAIIGGKVEFKSTYRNGIPISKYTWNLGNGTTIEGLNPEVYHNYFKEGSYSVSLSVISENGEEAVETKENIVLVEDPEVPFPDGAIHCTAMGTEVVEVINPETGKIWMDRNLGASRVAQSSDDELAYGDLYQWGRFSDGHQCRTSLLTSSLSNSAAPSHDDFIIIMNLSSNLADWLSSQNENLWQGINGENNTCPEGFQVPTEADLNEERLSWSSNDRQGAFNSPLKFTASGRRSWTGEINGEGTFGGYWSCSTFSSIYQGSRYLRFVDGDASINGAYRIFGSPVRCIKD